MNKAFDSLMNQARAEMSGPEHHPDLEDLAALARIEKPAETDPIMDHLARCRDCSDLVLAMRQESQEENLSIREADDTEVSQAWERLQARLKKPPEARGFVDQRVGQPVHPKPLWARLWFAYPIAAILLVGILISNRNPKPGIHTDAKYIYLEPIERRQITRGLPESESATETKAGRLILSLSSTQPEYLNYRITIKSEASGQMVFKSDISRLEGEPFVLILDQGALSLGSYQIQILGDQNGSLRALDTYELVINDP